MDDPVRPSSYGARPRGFAALDPARRSAVAREGGRAAHEKGTAHQFTPDEARAASLKGRLNRFDVSRDGPAGGEG